MTLQEAFKNLEQVIKEDDGSTMAARKINFAVHDSMLVAERSIKQVQEFLRRSLGA